MIFRLFHASSIALILAGCATTPRVPPISADPFHLLTAPDGHIYRIDSRTGRTSFLQGGVYREIPEPTMPQLIVGKVYRAEDGKETFRYSGNGLLEKWGLDKYNLPATPTQK